jgi:hypothetical protein
MVSPLVQRFKLPNGVSREALIPSRRKGKNMLVLNRRTFLHQASVIAGSGLLANRVFAQQGEFDPEFNAADFLTSATQSAINKGLQFLTRRQNEDGSFAGTQYSRNVAVCSLSGLAFMANGSVPGRGKYGQQIIRCTKYVLASCRENGFITEDSSASHGPMYGHGFATLYLAEVYGMSPDSVVREKLSRAVRLIIDTQSEDGGWRYDPEPRESDISVTICQVMALRAARNAGIYVPDETIERCIEYVKRSQNPDGGFMYMIHGGESAFPRSAAGVVALFSAGVYEGEEIRKGLDYLMRFVPKTTRRSRESHFFYGHYYAVQAMWHAGGKRWQKWYPAIRDVLVERQRSDGSWADSICPEYGTAMASLTLQMPNNYLPIFQR